MSPKVAAATAVGICGIIPAGGFTAAVGGDGLSPQVAAAALSPAVGRCGIIPAGGFTAAAGVGGGGLSPKVAAAATVRIGGIFPAGGFTAAAGSGGDGRHNGAGAADAGTGDGQNAVGFVTSAPDGDGRHIGAGAADAGTGDGQNAVVELCGAGSGCVELGAGAGTAGCHDAVVFGAGFGCVESCHIGRVFADGGPRLILQTSGTRDTNLMEILSVRQSSIVQTIRPCNIQVAHPPFMLAISLAASLSLFWCSTLPRLRPGISLLTTWNPA